MGLYFKITAGLLLLVQAIHLASLQNSTDLPKRTIPPSWLREKAKNTAESQNVEEDTNSYSSGMAFGAMALFPEEEDNVSGHNKDAIDTTDDLAVVATTVLPTNVTTKQPEVPDATIPPTNETSDLTNSSQITTTGAKEESHNLTTTTPEDSTSFPDQTKHPDLQTTASSVPESNATQESTKPDTDKGLTDATESNKTTTVTTKKPEINETSKSSFSTTVLPSKTREPSPAPTTTAAKIPAPTTTAAKIPAPTTTAAKIPAPTTTAAKIPAPTTTAAKIPAPTTTAAKITPERANKTASENTGLATDNHRRKSNGAWGAILGTGVAVTFMGVVAYIILKKKHYKGFSHSKLVEDFPSDPVHRLDNGRPLDLNFGFGGSAYYNPGLQGDNIQMSNLPERH